MTHSRPMRTRRALMLTILAIIAATAIVDDPVAAAPLPPPAPPDAPGWFAPLVPARLLDTRPDATTIDGQGRPEAPLGPDGLLELLVVGRGGVPATGVSAVVLNVTAVVGTEPSYLTLFPTGAPRPEASNLNFARSQIVPNLVVAKVGVGGTVSIYNLAGEVDVVVDVAGYLPSTDSFVPLVPARLLDTRPGLPTIDGLGRPGVAVAGESSIDVQVTGRAGVPEAGVDAVVVNLTVTNATAPTHVTAWPTGAPRPLASNLNVTPGSTIPNLAVVKVGGAGAISLFNQFGSVDLIADVAGYFPIGETFVALQPARLIDTRQLDPSGPSHVPLLPQQTRNVKVLGAAGIPTGGVAAVVLNVTAISPARNTFLTVWPFGTPRPLASNLNPTRGVFARPNLVVARVGAGGAISVYNLDGVVDVAIDVAGYFREEPAMLRTLATTDRSACVLDRLGRLTCWGATPQDPSPPYVSADRRQPYRVMTPDGAVDVALARRERCELVGEGGVRCWTAPPIGAPSNPATPTSIAELGSAVDIDGDGARLCALETAGTVACWDVGAFVAEAVAGLLDVVEIALGPTAACARRADGSVACWGTGGSTGILGDGLGTDSPNDPVQVVGIDDAIDVDVGGDRACAVRAGGRIACWGAGHLGDGTPSGSPLPVTVVDAADQPITDASSVDAATGYSCYVTTSATVRCWGDPAKAALGLVPAANPLVPTDPTPGAAGVRQVEAVGDHACAMLTDDTVRCWGDSSHYAPPVPPPALPPVVVYPA